ncbi:hypothetical protein HRG84_17705 [Flavisolibacter sp. BT320]|nr:hypothetical protein [Flavisolibacter longurius]
MKTTNQNEPRERVIRLLQQFPSEAWINRCFDLLKRMLTELGVQRDDPRLTICVYKDNQVLVSFGTLPVFVTDDKQRIMFMVPHGFKRRMKIGENSWQLNSSKQNRQWETVKVQDDKPLPQNFVDAWITTCSEILPRRRRAKVKENHLDLLYDFTTESAVRNEILGELKPVIV